MHDLYLSTVIFHGLASVAPFGVCALHAVRDPLRRRTSQRAVLINETAQSVLPESVGMRVLHNRLIVARILEVSAEAV
jgi:hypothetical protein